MKKFIEFLKEEVTSKFKPQLKNYKEIADYIESNSVGYVDREQIEEFFRGAKAVLKEVDIDSIREGNAEGNLRKKAKETKYAAMKTQAPPIVVENGEIVDGNHRYRVAKSQGKTKIWIYDIVEEY